MIKIADLYAGIGGIRLGFEQAFGKENVDCVFTSEIDKHAVTTYSANFGNENIFGDIKGISETEIPDHDILLAGFPCQPFSNAGLKKGFNDERGQAFFEIERILKAKKPKVFLLENVPNLKGINNGEIFQLILERLKHLGYKVNYEILSGKDFGVPQNRRRLYIVGHLDQSKDFEFPKPSGIETHISDIVEENVNESYCLSDHRWTHIQERMKFGSTGWCSYKIFDEAEPYTVTLVARYLSHPEKILLNHPTGNPRRLTERECARLQGFPDYFVINKVPKTQIYKQLGNSVCVPVIKAIAEQIKKNFFEII